MLHREKVVYGHLNLRDVNRWTKKSESGRKNMPRQSEPVWPIQVCIKTVRAEVTCITIVSYKLGCKIVTSFLVVHSISSVVCHH